MILVELTVLKDVIFILAIGAVAFVLSMGLKILVFLGQLSFVAAFLWCLVCDVFVWLPFSRRQA